jgi:hypothetical protein
METGDKIFNKTKKKCTNVRKLYEVHSYNVRPHQNVFYYFINFH